MQRPHWFDTVEHRELEEKLNSLIQLIPDYVTRIPRSDMRKDTVKTGEAKKWWLVHPFVSKQFIKDLSPSDQPNSVAINQYGKLLIGNSLQPMGTAYGEYGELHTSWMESSPHLFSWVIPEYQLRLCIEAIEQELSL